MNCKNCNRTFEGNGEFCTPKCEAEYKEDMTSLYNKLKDIFEPRAEDIIIINQIGKNVEE